MKILFLSGRGEDCSRNRIILKILKQNYDVKVCTTKNKNYVLRIITTFFKFFYYNIFFKKDFVFVGFFGQPFIPFVRIFTRKKIIFDAFLSTYNTLVDDRKIVRNKALKKLIWYHEYLSCKLADIILLDTNQHINYFTDNYSLSGKKFERFIIGVDSFVFDDKTIKKTESTKLRVVFHGNFIPLHGVEYIIKAAALLPREMDITFYIIGAESPTSASGSTFKACQNLVREQKLINVYFLGRKNYYKLPKILKKADIGLGIFGDTKKTQLVIPNKVYELAAIGVPIITSDTPAIREIFTDKKDIILCKSANPESLSKVIINMAENPELRYKIAKNAYNLFEKRFSHEVLSKRLIQIIDKIK